MPTAQELIAAYQAGGNKPLSTGQILGTSPLSGAPSPAPSAPAKTTISTPVISATDASKKIQTEIKPTLDEANAQLRAQQEAQRQRSIALASGQITDQASMDAFKKQQEASATKQPVSATDQATMDIVNQPEEGNKWVYLKDGTRIQIKLNQDPSMYGASDTKPVIAPKTAPSGAGIQEEITQDDDTSYGKMGDGTYAKFDAQGNYLGSLTQDQYERGKLSDKYQLQVATKNANEVQDKINQIINGTYPLSPDQQAQIESVKQTFMRLIDQQVFANKNYEGGVATAQGLLGMSEYSPTLAMGTLKGAIDSGISKVSELNNKMIGAITEMNMAFRSDNMKMLESAYNRYSEYAEKKQKHLDDIAKAASEHEKDLRDYNLNVEKFYSEKEENELNRELKREDLSWQEKKALLDDKYKYANLSEEIRHNKATELEAQRKRLQDLMGDYFDPNTPFSSTINNVVSLVPQNQKSGVQKMLASAAQRGDWKQVKTLMRNGMVNNLPTAQDKNEFTHAEDAFAFMTNMERYIKQLQASGLDTGYLKGNYDQITTKLGQLAVDPKFKDVATQMQNNFFEFRNKMTGAAFSPEESKAYASVVPTEDKSIDLNLATISGAKTFAQNKLNSIANNNLGEGYANVLGLVQSEDSIQNYVNNATAEEQQRVAQMVQDKVPYAEIIKFFGIEE